MTDYLSILPAELFPQIFDDLSMDDILASLCYVNKRLRALCLSHPRFRFDFDSFGRKETEFQSVCAHLPFVSSRILSLRLSKQSNSDMSLKISRFFSRFLEISDSFSRLHSIIVDPISKETWRSINRRLTKLDSLVSLSICCPEQVDLPFASELLRELLYGSSTLKRLRVKVFVSSSDAFIVEPCPETTSRSQIEHFSLQGIRVELRSLFSVTRALQSLDVNLQLFQFQTDTRFYSPETIRQLKIYVNFIELREIETMLHSLGQLTDLTVHSNNVQYDMADGWTWRRLLKSVLTFKFRFTFDLNTFTSPTIDLTSFRSPFWLEEKRWFVTYERCRDNGFAMLYSNSYCLDEYPFFFMRDQLLVESTASTATVFPPLTTLSADSPFPAELTLQLRHWLSCCTRGSLADCGTTLRSKVDYAMEHLPLSQITSFTALQCETDLSSDVFVKFLQGLPRLASLDLSMCLLKRLLISEWTGIRSLRLWANVPVQSDPLSLCETDAFCRSFQRVDRLSMSIGVLPDLSLVLNNIRKMPILAHLSIFPYNRLCERSSEKIIDRDWLETNTQLRHFNYSRDKNGNVNLWL